MPWHETTITHSTNTKHGYKHDRLEDNALPQLTSADPTLCTWRLVSDCASMCRPASHSSFYRHHQTPPSAPSIGIRLNYLIHLGLMRLQFTCMFFGKWKLYRIILFACGLKLKSLYVTKYLYNVINSPTLTKRSYMFQKFPHCLLRPWTYVF